MDFLLKRKKQYGRTFYIYELKPNYDILKQKLNKCTFHDFRLYTSCVQELYYIYLKIRETNLNVIMKNLIQFIIMNNFVSLPIPLIDRPGPTNSVVISKVAKDDLP